MNGKLRCVIAGGDEPGVHCGASCTRQHSGACVVCRKSFGRHRYASIRF